MSVNDDELRQVFDAFDEDKNGEISPKELFNVLNHLWKDEEKAKRGAAVSVIVVVFDDDDDDDDGDETLE